MERYYNFGGEGVLAASALGVPAVLEVNAPDRSTIPGSTKARLDRALLVEPMRRWRDRHLPADVDLFVTPTADILPAWVDRDKVLEIEWGADVDHFRPDAPRPPPFTGDPRARARACSPARSGRGTASCTCRPRSPGCTPPATTASARVFIGDGPERAAAERAARGVPGVHVHRRAAARRSCRLRWRQADIGVAPFDPARHAPLRLGFYWSPLKIFEYMAVGLPVVAPALPRLRRLVEHGREGVLYDPDDPRGLDRALVALADPGSATRHGRRRARARRPRLQLGRRTARRSTRGCARWCAA